MVSIFFEVLTEGILAGERVELRGFGSFVVKDYKAYLGRNPRSGELVTVKPKRLPYFKAGKNLKLSVSE
jgi:integration host factor subunit beta